MTLSWHILFEATLRTLLVGFAVAILSGVFGIIAAWLITRTTMPGRNILSGLLAIPYALPPYLLGMAWVVLGNPTVGILKDVLPGATGAYGFWGMTLVLFCVGFAYPYLELKTGFERMDSSLEEAARMSGASPTRVFFNISLPLLWPSLLNGMCLAFLHAISAFGVPALLGLPVRKYVLTTLIYAQLRMGGLHGMSKGFKLSLILLVIAVVALGVSAVLNYYQRKRSGAIVGSKSSRPSLVDLGPYRYLAAGFIWVSFTVMVILPWLALLFSALAPVAGKYSPADWSLKNLQYVLHLDEFKEALINSTLLTLGTSTLIVALGFILAFLSVRKNHRWAQALIESLGLPFSTPGTVIAMCLIYAAAFASAHGVYMDSPLILMTLAYMIKFSAVAARTLVEAFRQVHPSLEEAARVSGASLFTLLRTIWFPLLKKSLGASWLLVALPMFTELTMSILLTGPGGATLGTILFRLQEYADQPSAAALALLLLTVALVIGLATRLQVSLKRSST